MSSIYACYPSLADRVVVVTGGATGIGATIVEHFAAQAAKVAFFDIDRSSGEALASKLAADARRRRCSCRAICATSTRFGPP